MMDVIPLDTGDRVPSGNLNLSELKTKLQETYVKIVEDETRKSLLETLVSENLGTRDVLSFIKTQASLRHVDKRMDVITLRSAMKTKIKDLRQSRKRNIQIAEQLENNLRTLLENKRSKFRRHMNQIRKHVATVRDRKKQAYRKKLDHYRSKQLNGVFGQKEQDMALSRGIGTEKKKYLPQIPKNLMKYKNLSIFRSPDDLPRAKLPLGPFLCDKGIKLTEEELLVLRKDPKFSVRQGINKSEFKIETEKMLAKHRYNECGHKKFNKKNMRGTLDLWASAGARQTYKPPQSRKPGEGKDNKNKKKVDRKIRMAEIWKECRHKYVYDPINKSVGFANRRATDYKMNKFVHLPKAIDDTDEFYCEERRRKYLKIFDMYVKKTSNKVIVKPTTTKRPTAGRKKERDGKTMNNKTKKKKITPNLELNITKKEKSGLESLKKRIKEGELIIAQTDKSSRFAALTRDQYLQAGKKHTSKDERVDWKVIKRLQRITNDHMWWLAESLNYSRNTDSQRMARNLQDHGAEVPEMILLVKDHKDWTQESGKVVPTRPVVSGNKGLNTHLSELLSEILEPVSLNMLSAEVSSTEEVLHKISSYNDYLHKGGDIENLNELYNFSDRQDESSTLDPATMERGDDMLSESCGSLVDLLTDLARDSGHNVSEILNNENGASHESNLNSKACTSRDYIVDEILNNENGASDESNLEVSTEPFEILNNENGARNESNLEVCMGQFEILNNENGARDESNLKVCTRQFDDVDEISNNKNGGSGNSNVVVYTRQIDNVDNVDEIVNNETVLRGKQEDVPCSEVVTTIDDKGDKCTLDLKEKNLHKYFIDDNSIGRSKTEASGRPRSNRRNGRVVQQRMTDFFKAQTTLEPSTWTVSDEFNWCKMMEKTYRNGARNNKNMNKAIGEKIKASQFWEKKLNCERRARKESSQNTGLQDFGEPPTLVGGDVEALYPSMDPIPTSLIAYKAVKESPVAFTDINYWRLNVYLYLVLGEKSLRDHGLPTPNRVLREGEKEKSTGSSLAAKSNRDLNNWANGGIVYTEEEERELLALTVQVGTLLLMTTSCYSFGGELFRQKEGSGIGLRGSACLAKILMAFWDKTWGVLQKNLGLRACLFFRYIDDLRVLMAPISKGWWWRKDGWVFDISEPDDRGPEQRTREEIAKSLSSVFDFLNFTAESGEEFENLYLPTLDVQIKVLPNGRLTFKHYYKPMVNNIVLENGTALSKGTVFSSLRQDLVRRLLNTSLEESLDTRLEVIEDFTQLLTNSKHRYQFIKSIILQALTKYEFMVARSTLDQNHKKYQPLYRPRSYQEESRKILKYINVMTWYTGENLGDPYRQHWKANVKRKGDNITNNRARMGGLSSGGAKITTTMFVPSTRGGQLLAMLEELEEHLSTESQWGVKLVEKAGSPLRSFFIPTFPLLDGCIMKELCRVCNNTGIMCRPKGIVYTAECTKCKFDINGGNANEQLFDSPTNVGDHVYVGESSRTFRLRVKEHMDALNRRNPKSFQVIHWAEKHEDDIECPVFKFKMAGQYKDALTRQISEAILISEKGGLNKKCEFRVNELCRLVPRQTAKEQEELRLMNLEDKEQFDDMINKFIQKINNRDKADRLQKITNVTNEFSYDYRSAASKRSLTTVDSECPRAKYRKKMAFSTPRGRGFEPGDSPPGMIQGITPISKPDSPDLVDPEIYLSESASPHEQTDKGRTNMSNELRGSILAPRKLETSDEEKKSWNKEVEMLLKSADTKNYLGLGGEIITDETLEENYFSGRMKVGRGDTESRQQEDILLSRQQEDISLSDFSNWSEDSFARSHLQCAKEASKVVLGIGASHEVLEQPATPSRLGEKRLLSPGKKTPMGRPRKFSTSIMDSPSDRLHLVTLRSNEITSLMGKEGKEKFIGADAVDGNITGADGAGKKKQLFPDGDECTGAMWWKKERKVDPPEHLGGLNLTPSRPLRRKRISRKLPLTPGRDKSQPLISDALTLNRKAGSVGQGSKKVDDQE